MIDDQEFSLEDDGPRLDGDSASTTAPKVVIEYRSRGIPSVVLSPLLILLAALVIQSYQRETPIRRLRSAHRIVEERAPEAVTPAAAAAAAASTEQGPPVSAVRGAGAGAKAPSLSPAPAGPPPEPVVAAQETAPPAAAEPVAATPEPPRAASVVAPEPPPEAAEARPPVKRRAPDPPALASNLVPDPAPPREVLPEVSREQVLAEIQREADRKEAEIQRLEALKPQLRYFQIAEMFRKAHANRIPFHDALRQALRSRKPDLGKTIESLCNEYGRSTSQEIQMHFRRLLKTSYARLSRRSKVELMRVWGFPEPMVLDFLANDLDRMVGTRGGPRSEDDVRVLAARLLLTMPPPSSPSKTTSPFPGAEAGRIPAAAGRPR